MNGCSPTSEDPRWKSDWHLFDKNTKPTDSFLLGYSPQLPCADMDSALRCGPCTNALSLVLGTKKPRARPSRDSGQGAKMGLLVKHRNGDYGGPMELSNRTVIPKNAL